MKAFPLVLLLFASGAMAAELPFQKSCQYCTNPFQTDVISCQTNSPMSKTMPKIAIVGAEIRA